MVFWRTMLFLHLLGAGVWTGGHLLLALRVLPGALRSRDPEPVRRFEALFEPIGLPALLIQIATGLALGYRLLPGWAAWLELGSPLARNLALKLLLLFLTLALAVHARLRLIPRLDAERLPALAVHIAAVTGLALLFMLVGLGFRTGGLF